MKRAAGIAGSCPSASVARTRLRLHRCTLIRALLVATVLLTPGLVSARQFPAPATPSETFRASSQQNASAAAALPGDPFSLTLDALHSQGLRRHSRSLKQSSCPNAESASSTCKTVSQSQIDTWRNVLVSQCSSVIPTASGSAAGGCCSGLPAPGSTAWTNFVSCACSTLSSEVSAFVSVPSVLSNCGSGSGSGSSSGSSSGSGSGSGSSSSSSSSSSRSSSDSSTTNPPNSGSPSSFFNPFPNSPPSSPNGVTSSSPPSLVTTSRPPNPPASLESGPISGGNLASFQNALSGGSPPGGSSGTSISDIPASNNQFGTVSSSSSTGTPSTPGNSGNNVFPVADSSIG